jgi:hypothetical protein
MSDNKEVWMPDAIGRRWVTSPFVLILAGSASGAIPVIQENFQDDAPGGSWKGNFGNLPTNVGLPGQWLPSGHIANLSPFFPNNMDNDWRPLVQSDANDASGSPANLPAGVYMASLNRVGVQTGTAGVFNMDGIIKFTLANGTARPAVTGEKIRGSFDFSINEGIFGFGFTDNISALQSYQASLPPWVGTGSSPVMMPTGFTDREPDGEGGFTRVGFSPNVTGQISINTGFNGIFTHACVDVAENGGAGDGFVDQGNNNPKTDPLSTAHRPLATNARQTIKFEYTVGNSVFDLLQVDQDGPDNPLGFVDILQMPDNPSTPAKDTPNPNGPMPIGKIMPSIEGFFFTGGHTKLTEAFYDNIFVELVPSVILLLGDANHDGTVNTLDFDELSSHFNQTTTLNWANGDTTADFNGDGVINAMDFNAIAANFGSTASGSALGEAVPEPASLGVLGLIALSLVTRRARRVSFYNRPTGQGNLSI